ncbi:hypothetical protein [Streptosporangium sp. NPDC048865]|uniref:hypothetical protein n=1 Tax=Streptosporangium sp. NPDC048865 TaxID=3155766 RepID=UPI00342F745F
MSRRRARVVAIGECAGHAIVAADVSGCRDGEQTPACSLYERLEEDMPLPADRGFHGFSAWGQARRTGARSPWRMRAGPYSALPPF